jgi:cysteine sulfinate desulfinase/cysteine desulfurase-like protein
MGCGEEGMSALRVSLGRRTMAGEVDAFLAALPQAAGEARGA